MSTEEIYQRCRMLAEYAKEQAEKTEDEIIYLGTVFSLAPSGKYYTPFLSDLSTCPKCGGVGCEYCGELGSREAYEDQLFYAELCDLLGENGLSLSGGEGDPCDLFAVI